MATWCGSTNGAHTKVEELPRPSRLRHDVVRSVEQIKVRELSRPTSTMVSAPLVLLHHVSIHSLKVLHYGICSNSATTPCLHSLSESSPLWIVENFQRVNGDMV
jgi:flagellar motor switch protein FliM